MKKLMPALLAVALVVAASPVRGAAIPATRLTHYSLQPMAVHYNAWGAYGTNSQYNPDTTAAKNSVTTRLIARGNNVAAISLNEMCVAQSFKLTAQLAAAGLSYGGYFLASRSDMTHAQCGTQFGNVAYVNGGTVGSPYTHYYPNQQPNSEWRNVICIRNSFHYSCTTHLAAGASWYTYDQLYRYRDIVNVIAVSSGLGVYASGDFNAPLQTSWYSTWTGWLEADSSLNRVTYPPNSAKFDYVFRRTPASWSHGAYVAMFPGLSDHLWVQGYL